MAVRLRQIAHNKARVRSTRPGPAWQVVRQVVAVAHHAIIEAAVENRARLSRPACGNQALAHVVKPQHPAERRSRAQHADHGPRAYGAQRGLPRHGQQGPGSRRVRGPEPGTRIAAHHVCPRGIEEFKHDQTIRVRSAREAIRAARRVRVGRTRIRIALRRRPVLEEQLSRVVDLQGADPRPRVQVVHVAGVAEIRPVVDGIEDRAVRRIFEAGIPKRAALRVGPRDIGLDQRQPVEIVSPEKLAQGQIHLAVGPGGLFLHLLHLEQALTVDTETAAVPLDKLLGTLAIGLDHHLLGIHAAGAAIEGVSADRRQQILRVYAGGVVGILIVALQVVARRKGQSCQGQGRDENKYSIVSHCCFL